MQEKKRTTNASPAGDDDSDEEVDLTEGRGAATQQAESSAAAAEAASARVEETAAQAAAAAAEASAASAELELEKDFTVTDRMSPDALKEVCDSLCDLHGGTACCCEVCDISYRAIHAAASAQHRALARLHDYRQDVPGVSGGGV